MNGNPPVRFLLFGAFVMVQCGTEHRHPNMYLDSREVAAIRRKVGAGKEPWRTAYGEMLSEAERALGQEPLSVTFGGPAPPGGDVHDYCSEPPYVTDGVADSTADRTDYMAAIALGKAVRSLGLGYAFTGKEAYAEKAVGLIGAWCIDEPTRMNPRFTVPQSYIELCITMPGLFYGADLVWGCPGWDASGKAGFVAWTKSLGESGMQWTRKNNFENWRLVLVSSAGVIAQDAKMIRYAFDRWKAIIKDQMTPRGCLIEETRRKASLSYSLYALNAMIQTAEIARHRGVGLYGFALEDGRGLERALDYHASFALDPSGWRFEQMHPLGKDSVAFFELAYAFGKKPEYRKVIEKWGRPAYETRTMGPVTLTHARR